MVELKPCPFCGYTIADTQSKVLGGIKAMWVECWACHAQTGKYSTEDEAIEAWNARDKDD